MDSMAKVVATYHKDCIDGTTAAAVLLRKFPEAKLFPLAHAYTPADLEVVLQEVDAGTICYTLDCGLGVQAFLDKGCQVTTIDHHIGGKAEFEALQAANKNYTYVFNNEKSGASLAWSYLFSDEPLPELIKLVEDSDLWLQKFGKDTKDVNNYLSMFRNDPAAILRCIEGDLKDIKEKGSVITMYADKEVEEQIALPSVTVTIGSYQVPAFNITSYTSASGNFLAKKLGNAVAMFIVKGDEVKFSFRSLEGYSPSSLELAKLLGGGGHQNAAGATVSLSTFLKMLIVSK